MANFKNNKIQKTNIEEIKGRVLETAEVIERIKFQLKYTPLTGCFMLMIMIGMTIGAYFAGQNMIDLTQNGKTTAGYVSNIISRTSSDNNGYTYYAEVSFNDQKGQRTAFKILLAPTFLYIRSVKKLMSYIWKISRARP